MVRPYGAVRPSAVDQRARLFSGHDATSQPVLTGQGVFLDGHDTVSQREAGTRSLLDSLAASLPQHFPRSS
jgi:hypothetical protein